jgi:hypothetical protein
MSSSARTLYDMTEKTAEPELRRQLPFSMLSPMRERVKRRPSAHEGGGVGAGGEGLEADDQEGEVGETGGGGDVRVQPTALPAVSKKPIALPAVSKRSHTCGKRTN